MTGTHKAIASNPKAVARLQKIKADAIKAGQCVTECRELAVMDVLENNIPQHIMRYGKVMVSYQSRVNQGCYLKPATVHAEVIVLTITGQPVFRTRKAPRNPLYLPFKGPSAVEYVPSDEDLAFFAETASLPDGEATARLAVAA